ncbi:MAG TPA: hypothetical protein VFG98_04105, partial [Intrasporangium sp.]|nr:hypothetical protein [Intrasporangium sp.]
MTRPTPLSQVVADDLLIERVAGRQPAGDDPIAGLLAALAEHADRPLGRAPTGRRFRHHRVLSTLAALTIGASGASVAAAVTLPAGPPSAASARVAPAPARAGSAPGAELVRDVTGRVTVVGADGTRVESAWLPDGPVVLTPASDLGRGFGAEASRNRWAAIGSTALVLTGPEQDLGRQDPDGVDSTGNDGLEEGAGTDPADEAATPMGAGATPVDETAPEPTPDATPTTTPSDDATDQSGGTGEGDATPSGSGTTEPAADGDPAEAGTPDQAGQPGVNLPSGTPHPPAVGGPQVPPADNLPTLALPVPAAEPPVPTPPAGWAPADDAVVLAAPT